MNEQHYEAVKQVLDKCEPILESVNQREGPSVALAETALKAAECWKRAFPEGWADSNRLDLEEANLSEGLFAMFPYRGHPLTGANFRRAQLDGTRWVRVILDGCDFSGANLGNSHFVMADFRNSVFAGADFTGANVLFRTPEGPAPVDFSNAIFTNATLLLTGPVPARLNGACFTGATVRSVYEDEGGNQSLREFLAHMSKEQRRQLKSSRCFIATAACGSADAGEVQLLRAFRDRVLCRSSAGQAFIRRYETCSPPIAAVVAKHRWLRAGLRAFLIRPASATARAILKMNGDRGQAGHY